MYTRAPHRRPSADMADAAALLIDFDNVTMGIRSNLGQELRNFLDSDIIRGKVAVQRAYADWRRYPQYIVPLSESSIDLIFAPAYGSSKKNATDIRLAIDALELVFIRPEIGTFILLSGDSDFSSLVLKLKEYGKYVIGVGLQESTSDILVQNCDEYYSYNRLSGLTAADELQTEKHDPWELTGRAVARMAERGDVMRSDRLKQVMLEMDPGFDEKTAGFSRFNRFLSEAAKRDRIVLQKRENGQYDIGLPSGAASASASGADAVSSRAEAGTARSRGRRGRRGGSGRGRDRASAPKASEERTSAKVGKPSAKTKGAPAAAVEAAYEALKRAVAELSRDGAPVRDSMAKRKLLQYDAAFDEGSFGFSKFSLFLRAAHEAGVIRMSRQEDGNHYLTAADPPAAPTRKSESAPATGPEEVGGRSPLSAAARAARKTLGRFRRGPAPRSEAAPSIKPTPRGEAASRASRRPAASRRPGVPQRLRRPVGTRNVSRKSRLSSGRRSRLGPNVAARTRPAGRGRRQPRRAGRIGARQIGARRIGAGPMSAVAGPPSAAASRRRGKRAPRSRVARRRRRRGSRRRRRRSPSRKPGTASPAPARRRLPGERSGATGRGRAGGRRRQARRSRRALPVSARSPTRNRPRGRRRRKRRAPTLRLAAGRRPKRREGPARHPAEPRSRPRSRLAKPAGGPIGHMVRNYAGVGKRTAEVLFDHFGDRVFEVIDSEPARLTEVLSEGRAKVVREARRAELDS